jgi:hypothetical protein
MAMQVRRVFDGGAKEASAEYEIIAQKNGSM